MGGGGDEDDRRELERLERDLAAIDARWSAEGYQQRTSSKVLDDERATRTELQLRIMKLEAALKSSSATPALGTGSVRSNIGGGWEPMRIYDAPPPTRPPGALPPAALDVEPQLGLDLAELKETLFTLVTGDWDVNFSVYSALKSLVKKWKDVPGAGRLLSAAYWSAYEPVEAKALAPLPKFEVPFVPLTLRAPLLTGADDLRPSAFTGLTEREARLLGALAATAPETGPFVPLAALLDEARVVEPQLTEESYVRVLAALGHPTLRPFPLVAFQGFSGRFDPQPAFTHARLTPVGREVLQGKFPLPMLLVNGAQGSGSCTLPYEPRAVMKACLDTLDAPMKAWSSADASFDLPSRATTQRHDASAVWTQGHGRVTARPVVRTEISPTQRRARIVIDSFPWPMSALDVVERIEEARAAGAFDGVTSVSDESSADEQRVVLELEHPVFATATRQVFTRTDLFVGVYEVKYRVGVPALAEVTPRDIINLFLEERRRAVASSFDQHLIRARQRAQELEAVCLALELLDRVQAITREALTDAEAASALLTFMRPEDRVALERLPHPPSHDYASGFTLEQARYVVKQRKLGTRPKDAAATDWARALAELEGASAGKVDRRTIDSLVRQELLAARDRFEALPRRSRAV